MTNDERDRMILETHGDVKWLKAWAEEHKSTHRQYLYYFIITAVGVIVSFII